jgi:hypothetical protein
MIDVMKKLKPIGELYKSGEFTAALLLLDNLWEDVPFPKESVPNSYLIVAYGVALSCKNNDLDRAWEWAQRGLPYSGVINLAGESELLIGEVAYARSDFESAKQYFKIVNKMSGMRLLKDKNPRFKQLIM